MGVLLFSRTATILILGLATPARAAEDCAFQVAPTHPNSTKLLLGSRPASIVAQLQSKGVTFAPANTRQSCGGYSHALVFFSQPRDHVLELLSQTARQNEFLSHEVVSIHRAENESIDEHRMRVLFTKVFYRVRNSWSRNQWKIEWSLDPDYDNSLRMLSGYWHLHTYEGGTLAVYGSKVDAGRVVPASIQAALTSNKLRQVVVDFRNWVESEGRYRP